MQTFWQLGRHVAPSTFWYLISAICTRREIRNHLQISAVQKYVIEICLKYPLSTKQIKATALEGFVFQHVYARRRQLWKQIERNKHYTAVQNVLYYEDHQTNISCFLIFYFSINWIICDAELLPKLHCKNHIKLNTYKVPSQGLGLAYSQAPFLFLVTITLCVVRDVREPRSNCT